MCMSAMPHCQKGCDSAVPSYPTEVAENPLSPGAKDSGYSSVCTAMTRLSIGHRALR